MTGITELMTAGLVVADATDLPPERPLAGDHQGMPPYLAVAEFVPQPPGPGPATAPPDPPIFLLQAAPTFAGGALPDGQWQRVPIGIAGQVLAVQADGSVAWITGGGGFSNPMTTPGDLITGGAAGAPQRLAVGSNGQLLTVSGGVPAWTSAALVNPMVSPGDLIVGGAAGAPLRLAASASNNQFLTTAGGAVTWGQGPMTALGDLIIGAAIAGPTRLGIGSNGQVLTVAAGVPTWQNSASGFANPMTAAGDLISATTGGAASRLAIGAPGQILTVSGGLPIWASPSSGGLAPTVVLFPSGDTSGHTDALAIQSAVTNMTPGGGTIELGPGNFYVNVPAGNPAGICVNLPAQTVAGATGAGPCNIQGQGYATVLYPVGAGVTGIFSHRTTKYGTFPTFFAGQVYPCSYVRDMVIDGANATGASIGIDMGDGIGFNCRNLMIRNFSGVGGIGLNLINRVSGFYTEESDFQQIYLSNNQSAVVFDTTGTANSHDYSHFRFGIAQAAGQNGIVLNNNVNLGGVTLEVVGNVQSSASPLTTAVLSLNGGASITHSRLMFSIETDQSLGNNPVSIAYATSASSIDHTLVNLFFSGCAAAILNGGNFSVKGMIADNALGSQSWPSTAFPGYAVAWVNHGPDALVCVAGGGMTGVSVMGIATGASAGGAFFVCAGGFITVQGAGAAPTTFNVIPAGWSQNA